MNRDANARFRRSMAIILGIAIVATMMVWAYNQGRSDGGEHRRVEAGR